MISKTPIKRSIIALFLGLLLFSLEADPMVLNLENCLEMALDNNPDLKSARISLNTAERNKANTWSNFLPSMSAGLTTRGSSDFLLDEYDPLYTLTGSYDMSLNLSPSVVTGIKDTNLTLEKSELNYESARRSLISSVEKEFYYLLTNESNLELVKTDLDLTRKRYKQVKSNYDNGRASELSVLQAEVNVSIQEPQYRQTVAAYESRMNDFFLTIGLEPGTDVTLEGSLITDIIELEGDKLIRDYLPRRLDIQELQTDLEIQRNKTLNTSLIARAPSLTMSAGWSASQTELFDHSGWSDWSDSLTLTLRVTLPLDDYIYGSSSSLAINSLRDQQDQKEIALEKALDQAETEITNLINDLNTSADNIHTSALNIALAQESYLLTEESFTQGLADQLEVDSAQQSYLSARQQYLSNQYNYLTKLIQLRDALGLTTLDELKN